MTDPCLSDTLDTLDARRRSASIELSDDGSS